MKKTLIITVLVVSAAAVRADESAFQASLTPDIAIHPRTTEIHGLSLNIWGENPQTGVALGFVNGSTGQSEGFSWAFLLNYSESYTGVQWGLVNYNTQNFVGWADAAVNFSQGTFTGLQSGFVNIGQSNKGVQFGFVNYTENLDGVQIGLANIAMNNDWFTQFPNQLAKGFPFVPWSF